MIKISLTKDAKEELHKAKVRHDIPVDRITAVLLNDQGMKAAQIAEVLNLNSITVRDCLRKYEMAGVDGLARKFSAGRPANKKEPLIHFLKSCLQQSPTEYGWDKETWDSNSIMASFKDECGESVSHDTVGRAMKELGYSYKKPQKSPSINAPSKENKLIKVHEIIDKIKLELSFEEAEVYCCDESHFTNEPYLPKGYFKKGREDKDLWPSTKRDQKLLWIIKSKEWKVFLEKH